MSNAQLTAARARELGPPRIASSLGRRAGGRSQLTWALLAVGLCLIGLALTWVLAALVPATHLRDAVLLDHFIELGRPRIDGLAKGLLALLDPLLYTVWALLLVATALLRRRPRVALAVALVAPAAPLAAELLKPLLAHPHASVGFQWVGPASWPSGHATAAMTLVVCALLVAPRALRPLVAALGCLFAAAVGVALLILAWHMPSDVFGGYLLATLFGSLAATALCLWDRLSAPDRRRRARPGPTAPRSPHPQRGRG
jgi:membrane-associated phospholipid phosphatase